MCNTADHIVSSMLSFITTSLYTCTYLLVQCSIFSMYLSLFRTGTKHSRVLLFVLCSLWRLPHSLPNLREQALSWKGEGSAWRDWTSSRDNQSMLRQTSFGGGRGCTRRSHQVGGGSPWFQSYMEDAPYCHGVCWCCATPLPGTQRQALPKVDW